MGNRGQLELAWPGRGLQGGGSWPPRRCFGIDHVSTNDAHHQGALEPFPKVPRKEQSPGGLWGRAPGPQVLPNRMPPWAFRRRQCSEGPAQLSHQRLGWLFIPAGPEPWRLKGRQEGSPTLGGERRAGALPSAAAHVPRPSEPGRP